jgi:hypothetical protein
MKRNMGSLDRLIRAFIAAPVLIIAGFAFGGSLLGIGAFVLAGVMLATAASGFCPLYVPFGLSTSGGISTHGHVRLG